jgi:hypothetical protein
MNTKTGIQESQETAEGLEMFWGDRPTELPSVLSGFTPAPDVLIKSYGYMTALVWGKVWRYCQMSDGVCRAALDRISEELGMSYNTILRHIKPLCDDGYLYDSTPELKNKPHIYSDTGKIRIRVSVEAQVYSPTKREQNVPLSHKERVTLPERESETPTERDEESNKKEKETKLTPEEVEQANNKVDAILKLNRKSAFHWKGRDYFKDNLVIYADWYFEKTGQICTKRDSRSWIKAFSEWKENFLQLKHLESARLARLKWKDFIADPNELTKDAKAIMAQENIAPAQPAQGGSGYYA